MTDLYTLPGSHGKHRATVLAALLATLAAALVAAAAAGALLAPHLGPRPPRPLLLLASYPHLPTLLVASLTAAYALYLATARRRHLALALLSPAAALALAAALPLFMPDLFFRVAWRALPPLAAAQADARLLFYCALAALALPAVAPLLLAARRLRDHSEVHGSSRWANAGETRDLLLVPPDTLPAIVVGSIETRGRRSWVFDTTDQHFLLAAPSGSGKSTSFVVPTLLHLNGSAVVFDPKGELFLLTAGSLHRRGHRILRFAPTEAEPQARFNPLLFIRPGDTDVADAQAIAEILVDSGSGDPREPFWQDTASGLITALLLHVLYSYPRPTLRTIYSLLTARDGTEKTLSAMRDAIHDSSLSRGWRDSTGQPTPTHPVVASEAQTVLDQDDRTRSGVIATVLSKLKLFADPRLEPHIDACDWLPENFFQKPTVLYLTIPPSDLGRLRPLLRILVNQTLAEIARPMAYDAGAPARPVSLLLLLDEFPALGKLPQLARAIAYLRGYRVRLYLSFQSVEQLIDVYGDHQAISSNCPLQAALAPADLPTADYLSRFTGTRTITFDAESRAHRGLLGQLTTGERDIARPLLTTDEWRRLPPDRLVIFLPGRRPILGVRKPYFSDPATLALTRTPPPMTSDRIPNHTEASLATAHHLPPPEPLSLAALQASLDD